MSHGDLPFHKHFIAGGVAGVAEILAMYPTDVLKTRAQLATSRLTMAAACRQIVTTEGWGSFYRGISAPVLAEAPKRAIKFSSNELYKKWFRANDGTLSSAGATAAGTLAGVSEVVLNCPFEVVKVRMQASDGRALYASTLDCFAKTVRAEGFFRGLYRGFESQLWRNGVWNGTYFGVIGTVRNMYPTKPGASSNEKLLHNLVTGCTAGGIASFMNTPFDVVKSRIQNSRAAPGELPKYRWAWPSVMTVGREEGLRALYKGLAPRLLRLGPGGGIMVVAFDWVAERIR